ncbi:hypothetical protein Aph01nite_54360 [Acrocarpospora phusangensis]|uniref:Uncharacterized protein n=1 Tax=Acrocarpospora phusangensis TaxID=1070424 RepID=A0A919QFU9_9ACTN|nr:hypothetical protein [Acrocarpospora phusangensis]GIH27126.1 hypothetical protein Aph01nite_54360 [Acrocarpospora phusangensis]
MLQQRLRDAIRKGLPMAKRMKFHHLSTTCQPWCMQHESGDAWPQDAYCVAVYSSPVFGKIQMFNNPGYGEKGPFIGLWEVRDVELTVDQAEEFGRAILNFVEAVRRSRRPAVGDGQQVTRPSAFLRM